MPNPYKVYQKNQGPGWLKQLDKYVETSPSNDLRIKDAETTVRNHGGDRTLVDEASYVEKKGRK